MTEELWRWSAERTARAIKKGDVSAVEVVTASLARLEATNDVSNAFGEVADDAVAKAQEADAAIARGDAVGPLHGVPVAFKLNANVEGLPTPDGVAEYLNRPAAETSEDRKPGRVPERKEDRDDAVLSLPRHTPGCSSPGRPNHHRSS